ncbi:DUF2511 domain-containing protein [Tatumella citrea]|uniref:DUF2511 domain-containing protein n=1 Tax=Tatumella citrea TaxID=53336 RepID=A0A1Y0LDJ2_TATCI|nr:DUF2511 domain-containing protein [Tatumella citrea]ARU96146.1 hypothetical protein A7K98_10670 [Tatumella citrea]ARV00183.1 hypothetical protein A7K99_10670 [Tatumella citrea]
MKKLLPMLLLLIVSSQALATQVITINRLETGKSIWPLRDRDEIMLTCEQDGALFAINPSTLMNYPLNDKALNRVKQGLSQGADITQLVADDKNHPGQKMSLKPFITKAQSLCGK